MSILIKMEMPKDCQHCPINEDAACSIAPNFDCLNSDTFLVADGARRDDCPLIELPPHGRLIDADALHIDLIDRGIADIQTNDWYEIRQAVDDAPTIIESEGEDGRT